MEGKPQSAEEVVEEDYPLVRFRGRNDLPHSGHPMRDIRGQVSSSAQLLDVSLRNGGSHPFVCGLIFYYGLDFHDLALNFVLNISAFIVVYEAFLRIRPHFGLWLKTFNIKLRVV